MINVFLPSTEDQEPGAPNGIERRRHSRHRYMQELSICRKDGTEISATSFEISESGMSAATPNYLNVGELVELFPIQGAWVKAIVRRKVGAMYGFQFMGLTEQQTNGLRKLCEGLPLFTTMADI
jgi:PilZ domain